MTRQKDSPSPPRLKRSLGLFETSLSGIGIILGAGIYALVGEAAGKAGDAVWLSFLLAALVAAVIGLSYAEMAAAFPKAGADYEYTRQALGMRAAFVVGWLIVIANLVAGAAVALGFGAYLNTFVDVSPTALALGLLVAATLVAFAGIRQAVWASIALSVVEAGGLMFIIALGVPDLGSVDLLEADRGLSGIFSGAALVMFAFIGFQEVTTLAEETENPGWTIPRALMVAIALTTALYLMVSVAAVSVLGWERLASSEAPLAAVAEEAIGENASDVLALIALFSTGNTVLLILVAASRLVYGMASTSALPRFLAWVQPGVHTPVRAILLCLLVSAGFALSGDIGLVAGATNFAVFVGFGAVNISLIVLRLKRPDLPRPFRVPLQIGRVPILPVIALAAVAFLMVNLEWEAIAIGGGLFLSGLVAMEALSLWRPVKEEQPAQSP